MEDPCQLCITEKPCSRYAMQYVFFQDSERGNGCFQQKVELRACWWLWARKPENDNLLELALLNP